MKSMFLILASPRVGNLGHRYLVSAGCGAEKQVLQIVRDAQSIPWGEDYVAVSRLVGQEIKGHGRREGTETLILAGVDDKRTRDQLREIQARLNGLWSEVDSLLERLEDPGSVSQTVLIIHRPELDKWLDQLPAASPPRAKTRRRRLKWAALGGLALVIPLLTLSLLQSPMDEPQKPPSTPEDSGANEAPGEEKTEEIDWWRILQQPRQWLHDRKRSRPDTPPSQPQADMVVEAERILDDRAKAWGCDKKDLAYSILSATGKTPPGITEEDPVVLVKREARSYEDFLAKLRDLDPEQPRTLVALFPDGPDHDTAEILLELLPSKTNKEDIKQLRRSLHQAWTAVENLRKQATETASHFVEYERWKKEASQNPIEQARTGGEPSGFRQVIRFFGSDPEMEPNPQRLVIHEPEAPIFDQQDILILNHIKSWLGKREVSGLRVALDQAKVEVPLNAGLAGQLNCLDQEAVGEALAMERGTAASDALTAKTRGAAIDPEAINSAYNAVGDFFARVGGLAGH